MKNNNREDLEYFLLSAIIVVFFGIVGIGFTAMLSSLSPKEKEELIILILMNNQN